MYTDAFLSAVLAHVDPEFIPGREESLVPLRTGKHGRVVRFHIQSAWTHIWHDTLKDHDSAAAASLRKTR